jgi:hypothetical protein
MVSKLPGEVGVEQMSEVKNSFSYAQDLRHEIQKAESIHLSDKSYSEILKTIQDAQYNAVEEKTKEMCFWRQQYYALKAEQQ